MEGSFSSLFNQFRWHYLHGKHHPAKLEIYVTKSLYRTEVLEMLLEPRQALSD